MITIHTVGDSHADGYHSHWGYIKIPNVNIITHHIGGKLMYSFGQHGLNLCNIKNYDVKNNDIVIFCFGEIDCRNHVHKHISGFKSYENIIDSLVESYFKSIKCNMEQYKSLKICVYNVIPPTKSFYCDKSHPFPFLGSDEERKMYYRYMNKKLEELCKLYGYFFFDIYTASSDNEGFLNKKYSDGNVHLRNTSDAKQKILELIRT
jgi:hypothetical protein|tara:strand:+ start:112 stop:729 length:618 start_codon:yes stop_codon:yes gene_type:complete